MLKRKRETPRRNEGRVQHVRVKRKRGDRTADEAAHMARIRKLPCLTCGAWANVHHLLKAPGKRAGRDHRWTVPLCADCHQGQDGLHWHGSEAKFERARCLPDGHLIAAAAKLWEESCAANPV